MDGFGKGNRIFDTICIVSERLVWAFHKGGSRDRQPFTQVYVQFKALAHKTTHTSSNILSHRITQLYKTVVSLEVNVPIVNHPRIIVVMLSLLVPARRVPKRHPQKPN